MVAFQAAVAAAPPKGARWLPPDSSAAATVVFKASVTRSGAHAVVVARSSVPALNSCGVYNYGGLLPLHPCSESACGDDKQDRGYLFYVPTAMEALPPSSRVVWLVCPAPEESSKRRMASKHSAPVGSGKTVPLEVRVRVEKNSVYITNVPTRVPEDHWMADPVVYPGHIAKWKLGLPILVEAGKNVELRARVLTLGYASQGYKLSFSLNGTRLGRVDLQGPVFYEARLKAGEETVDKTGVAVFSLESKSTGAPGSPPLYLDWVELSSWGVPEVLKFPIRVWTSSTVVNADEAQIFGVNGKKIHLLEITNERTPIWITGTVTHSSSNSMRFAPGEGKRAFLITPASGIATANFVPWKSASLRSKPPRVEYLIIAHHSLMAGARRLAGMHRGRGITASVLDYQSVADGYHAGVRSYEAVSSLVRQIRKHDTSSPRYVVLVGDTTRDVHGYLGVGPENHDLVPTGTVVSIDSRIWANDQLYDQSGAPHSNLQVARIPAETRDELKAYLDKVDSYLRQGPLADWTSRVGFVVDDGLEHQAANIELLLPRQLHLKKILLKDFPQAAVKPMEVTKTIIKEVDRGLSVLFYVGHGGHANWAHESILRAEHVSMLQNTGDCPVVVALTCLNGAFDLFLAKNVITEHLLFTPGKGAIGVLAAIDKLGKTEQVGLGVAKELAGGARRLGQWNLGGRKEVSNNPEDRDMFQVFGDPALVARVPLLADTDNNGRVDGADLLNWITRRRRGDRTADLNRDGVLDDRDLELLTKSMGRISR